MVAKTVTAQDIAQAVIDAVSANGDGWVINADQKRKDLKGFIAASQTGNDDDVIPFLLKFVKAWPYEYDPTLRDSYEELTYTEFLEVVKHVTASFQRFAEGIVERSGVSGDVARDNAGKP